MKRVVIILIVCIIVQNVRAQYSLEECQALARAHYPALQQLELQDKIRDLQLSDIARTWLPQFSVQGMGMLTEGMPELVLPGTKSENSKHHFVAMASVSQMLWDGNYSSAQRKLTRANAAVKKSSTEVELFQRHKHVNTLYFGILLLDEQLKQTALLRQTLTANLKRARTGAENGTVFPSEIDKLEVEILNTEQTRINLEAHREAYCKMLGLIIGTTIASDAQFQRPDSISNPNQRQIARPELEVFKNQREVVAAQNSLITASLMPKVGLAGYALYLAPNYSIASHKFDHLLVAGINLSWNTGALYTHRNKRREVALQQEIIRSQEETFRRNIEREICHEVAEAERLHLLIQKDSEIVNLRARIRQSAETRFANGVCTMTDLLAEINAENAARQTQAQHELELLRCLYEQKEVSGN